MSTLERSAQTALQAALLTDGQPVLFLSSGGSCLNLLSGEWRLPGDLTLGVLDERLTRDPSINNYRLLQQTDMYRQAMQVGANAIDTVPRSSDTVEQLADQLEAQLRTWRAAHPNGKIVATLGIGEDGHTAGMLPYPEDPLAFDRRFVTTSRWVTGYDAGGRSPYPLRATVTVPFLTQVIDEAIVYAAGRAKQRAIEATFSKTGNTAATPARIIMSIRQTAVFTDAV